MTLPSTGKISLGDTNVELQKTRTSPISLGNSLLRALAGKTTGLVKLSDLRGKTYVPPAGDSFTFTPSKNNDGANGPTISNTNAGFTPANFKGVPVTEFLASRNNLFIQVLFTEVGSAAASQVKGLVVGGFTLRNPTIYAGTTKINVSSAVFAITAAQFDAIDAAISGTTATMVIQTT